MQVVLVVHSQKQKMAMDAKRGFGTNERKIFFFFVNWWNAAEVWPLVEDRCSSDKMWWLDPRNKLGCVSTIVRRRRMKEEEEKTIISENLWGSLWNNSLRKKVEKVLGAAAKEKGCTYSWRTYEKLENSSSSRRMLGTWLNKSESWKCRIGRSREGNKNGKEENSSV